MAQGIPCDRGNLRSSTGQGPGCFQLEESPVCKQGLVAKCRVQEIISGEEDKLSFGEECNCCSVVLIVPSQHSLGCVCSEKILLGK